MKRHIDERLQCWFSSENKKPLIIKGARQVGKTYSIREFGKRNYKQVVEINFEKQLEYRDLFEKTHNPIEILDYLQLDHLEVSFDKTTLLFLDEIQACSHALTTLKFLAEEFPADIICSGSVLGVAIASTSSYPVGYVDTWEMVPLTFIEYLWASNFPSEWLQRLENSLNNLEPLAEPLHQKMIDYFKEYLIVGGMPEVVKTFLLNKSYKDALLMQRRIVLDYTNDMAKYASGSDRIKTRECFDSISLQLAKDNKKFQYKLVKEGYNSRYYESSLRWLEDGGLIIRVNRIKKIQKPLEGFLELPIFKIYMFDTGLLISQFDDGVLKDLMTGELGIYKGAIYENVVAQTLKAHNKKSYYYEPSNSSEIDFIIYFEGEIMPIEVKSSIRVQSVAFDNLVKTLKPKKACKISTKNIGVNKSNNVISIPFYLLEFLLKEEKEIVY